MISIILSKDVPHSNLQGAVAQIGHRARCFDLRKQDDLLSYTRAVLESTRKLRVNGEYRMSNDDIAVLGGAEAALETELAMDELSPGGPGEAHLVRLPAFVELGLAAGLDLRIIYVAEYAVEAASVADDDADSISHWPRPLGVSLAALPSLFG